MSKIEREYEDVLQNIEWSIVSLYRQQPEMTDWTVQTALEALLHAYESELRGREPRRTRLSAQEQELYARMRTICEWRLGREELRAEGATLLLRGEGEQQARHETTIERAISPEEIVACLKRLRLSLKRWNKEGGRRGYLDFVKDYVL